MTLYDKERYEDQRDRFADMIVDYVEGDMDGRVAYYRSKNLEQELPIGTSEIGMGLHMLKTREESPFKVSQWSSQNGTWRFEKKEGKNT